MDCIVMPSIAEGFPVTLVEAQAAGLPCIVSDVITKEIDITGTVSFISLNDSIRKWKKMIYANLDGLKRYENIEIMKSKGYDVKMLEKKVYKLL